MRVGVVSPNLLTNLADYNALSDDPTMPWPFEVLAKRASMLFDRLYLTEDLDLTCEVVGGGSAICDDDLNCVTLRYLADKGLILLPQHLGYASGAAFLHSNLNDEGRRLHAELLKVGNPSNSCGPGEYRYVGQPDVGDFEAHDGTHPRSHKGDKDPQIAVKKRRYESLLVRRNVALLRQAGCSQVAIVGTCAASRATNATHPVWTVVLHEMPDFNTCAPWEDVLGFRAESTTQHLIRSIRRWIRKIVAEEWTQAELEDEVRELLYEYERHLCHARFTGARGLLKCMITGTAELGEDIIKLRLSKLADLVTAVLERKAIISTAEAQAPGRELALIPALTPSQSLLDGTDAGCLAGCAEDQVAQVPQSGSDLFRVRVDRGFDVGLHQCLVSKSMTAPPSDGCSPSTAVRWSQLLVMNGGTQQEHIGSGLQSSPAEGHR